MDLLHAILLFAILALAVAPLVSVRKGLNEIIATLQAIYDQQRAGGDA